MAWAPDYYATDLDLKSYLRIEASDTADDAEIVFACISAARAVDKACGRQFGVLAAAAEWFYRAHWDRRRGRWIVPVDDFATTTGLVVKVFGTATTDYTVEPRQAVAKGLVWTRIVLGADVTCTAEADAVGVTALWGWPAVPPPVKQASLIQASRFLARRESPYGIAGSPADGSELRLLATVDPDVRVSLGHYVRAWSVAE